MFDKQLIEETLNYAKTKGAEFAEAFCEQTTSVATALDEKRIDTRSSGATNGVGIRVINNSRVGYEYHLHFRITRYC